MNGTCTSHGPHGGQGGCPSCIEGIPADDTTDTEAAVVWERGEQRTVKSDDGRSAGFVRFTLGGLWRAHSYRRGCGFGPFDSEYDARAWLDEQDSKGPIAGYSR